MPRCVFFAVDAVPTNQAFRQKLSPPAVHLLLYTFPPVVPRSSVGRPGNMIFYPSAVYDSLSFHPRRSQDVRIDGHQPLSAGERRDTEALFLEGEGGRREEEAVVGAGDLVEAMEKVR